MTHVIAGAAFPQDRARRLIRYWAVTLKDGNLSKGVFKRKALGDAYQSKGLEEQVFAGQLELQLVDRMFRGQTAELEEIEVELRPYFYEELGEPDRPRSESDEVVSPVVVKAWLNRNGNLAPTGKVTIPRELLEPLGSDGDVAIGSLDDLYRFVVDHEAPTDWDSCVEYWRKMIRTVCPAGEDIAPGRLKRGSGWSVSLSQPNPASGLLVPVYEEFLKSEAGVPLLLQRLTSAADSARNNFESASFSPSNSCFATRSGHASTAFGLGATQRDALSAVVAAEAGEIVAINGPPGTGKTTLILSVVASYWVNAALDGGDPPVIVATSTNNQAVTNVIEAFGKSVDEALGAFGGRWLPGVESYGSYFPARHLQAEAARSYQTEAFFKRLETDAYVADARSRYLVAGRLAYPLRDLESVDQIVDALHADLCDAASDLKAIGEAWERLQEADEQLRIRTESASSGNVASQEVLAVAATADWFEMLHALERGTIDEPFWWTVLGWLGSVRRKRLLVARQVVEVFWPSMLPMPEWESAEQIGTEVGGWAAAVAAQQEARSAVDSSIAGAAPGPGGGDAMEIDPTTIHSLDSLEALCDRTVRFRLFILASHYWEGRWLQAIDAIEVALSEEVGRTRLRSSVNSWRRRMMLTPCAVATLFTLPGRFTYGKGEGTKIVDRHLHDFIDLLIVDEAGQATPEVGSAAFGLAKRALVIGDTAQLEPIWNTGPSVDIANLESSRIIHDASDLEDRGATGITASSGSLMRMAQQVSRHHQVPELSRGLYLFEHRRCRADIIGYSNALCYDGRLQPLRAIDPDEPPLPIPTLAYGHIDGRCRTVDGSNANDAEARALAEWVAEQGPALERHYAKPIADIVAVVTPFRPQADQNPQAFIMSWHQILNQLAVLHPNRITID